MAYIKLNDNTIKPLTKSAVPGFEFNVNVTFNANDLIYDLGGSLFSEDDTYIGTIRVADERTLNGSNNEHPITVPVIGELVKGQQSVWTHLVVEIGERALKHLEETRLKNPKKDVILKAKLRWSQLSFSMKIGKYSYYQLSSIKPLKYVIGLSETLDSSRPDLSILNSDEKNIAFASSSNSLFTFRISHSDWTTDFYDAFGIGKVILLEAPSIVNNSSTKKIKSENKDYELLVERLDSIGKYFQSMLDSMKSGDWGEVVSKSRFIFEALTKNGGKEAIKNLILEDTVVEESNLLQLLNGLDNMFQFSSGLHHSLSKDSGTPKDVYVGRREDAELMYYLSVSLVNLLMSKVNRHGEN